MDRVRARAPCPVPSKPGTYSSSGRCVAAATAADPAVASPRTSGEKKRGGPPVRFATKSSRVTTLGFVTTRRAFALTEVLEPASSEADGDGVGGGGGGAAAAGAVERAALGATTMALRRRRRGEPRPKVVDFMRDDNIA